MIQFIWVIDMKNKKQKRNMYKTNTNTEFEYMKGIKVAIGVILILGLTWFATAALTGEIDFSKEEEVKEEVSIQYDEITVGQLFNRVEDEYYVLLFNFTDVFAEHYLSLIDSYKTNEDSLAFYIVDLEKKVNEEYVLKEGEGLTDKPNSLSKFKAVNPTIVKIKNHKVVERISEREKVLDFFEEN